ncbi:MAG: hypothetical protein WAS21_30610, partial [Geminicoccaceae bacterium]
LLEEALRAVSAPLIAFLEPGDHWPRDHLAALARAWVEAADLDLIAAPAFHLARAKDGSLRRDSTGAADPIPLSAVGVRATALLGLTSGSGQPALVTEIRRRCASLTRGTSLTSSPAVRVTRPSDGMAQPAADLESWVGLLAAAVASLPGSSEVVLVGLQAAHRPLAALEQLGLAVLLGRNARSARAFTLGDFTWAALDAAAPGAPLLLCTSFALDLAHASDLACLEEFVRRSGGRPVRICARTLSPSTPVLLGRLLEAVAAHPDIELWLGDAVSRHYAASLLGPAKVRLVPPPSLALAALLRELAERALIEPQMLGIAPADGPDFGRCMADPILWWQGVDLGAGHRLAQGLARVLGTWRWLKGPALQRAWLAALVGWARARAQTQPVRTSDPDQALLIALCGCPVVLEPDNVKTRDFAATWPRALQALGIAVA